MWRQTVLVVFCLAGSALADRDFLETPAPGGPGCTIGKVQEGKSGSLTFYYPRIGNSPGTANCTTGSIARCYQTLDNNALQGRSWYMTQDKAYFGQGYNPNFFQVYNLQCPLGHYLNLGLQGTVKLFCSGGVVDNIRVNTSRGDTGLICTDIEARATYLARSGGVILQEGKAEVDFCSSFENMDEGFYLRGTCINPIVAYNQPGCVSYEFFLDWDPEFVNDIDDAFDMVETPFTPHKRSAGAHSKPFESIREKVEEFRALAKETEEKIKSALAEEENERDKRGVRYMFYFLVGTEVTYENSMLTFRFPNGTVRSFLVYCLFAYNDLYGSRQYLRNATRQIGDTTGATRITFTGPGHVDIFPNSARTSINGYLTWTPPEPFESFLETEGIQQQRIAQRIYDYIASQWANRFVVVDDLLARTLNPPPFPLTNGPGSQGYFPRGVRTRSQVGIVYPTIEPGSVCKEAIRYDVAPLQRGRIDPELLRFCSFFQYACEPVLSTACREIMILDPFDVDPLTRQRMMMSMRGGD